MWAAEGTYQGDTGANAFTMMAGVNVYGGFAGNEPATFDLAARDIESHLTVLDGMGSRRVLNQLTSFTSDSTVWDGFTISRGRLANSGNYGAGAYLRQGGILSNCTVTGCRAYSSGGGVYSDGGTLSNCTFTADSSDAYGGGLYATNHTTVRNCVFTGNRAGSYGGAYFSYSNIYNSLVANNTANQYGGIYLSYGNMYNCNMVNNLSIYDNYVNSIHSSNIYNSLFWGNRTGNGQTPVQQIYSYGVNTFHNCAFEYNLPDDNSTSGQCLLLSTSNTGHPTSPRFVQPAYGAGADYAGGCNWILQEGSVLIDHGSSDTAVTLPATDLAGNGRVWPDGTVTPGAYEPQGRFDGVVAFVVDEGGEPADRRTLADVLR